MNVSLPAPVITYAYDIEDGPIIDNVLGDRSEGLVRVVRVEVTVFPDDEPSTIRCEARRVTKDGAFDRRYGWTTLVFPVEVDEAYLAAFEKSRQDA